MTDVQPSPSGSCLHVSGHRCRRRSRWSGGRGSQWSFQNWWSTADPSPSTRTVSVCGDEQLHRQLSPPEPPPSPPPPPQRSGRREPVPETCPPSRRPRRRSWPPAAEGSASCSTTGGSCPGFTPVDRGWTLPTTTLCPCGCAAPSWWLSTSRPQVTVVTHI